MRDSIPIVSKSFDGSTTYTATISLTAAPGYQFAAGTFSVAGADAVARSWCQWLNTAMAKAKQNDPFRWKKR